MKNITFIEDPEVIDSIFRHLKLTFQAERPPPQLVPQELLMALCSEGSISDSRWSCFLAIRGRSLLSS